MKLTEIDTPVHLLEGESNTWSLAKNIAESGLQEEAFYICDLGELVRKHDMWQKALPKVEPFYAVKCNDSYPVLKTLIVLGTNFACATKVSVYMIVKLCIIKIMHIIVQ